MYARCNMMKLRHIEVFHAVYQTGSVSGAARALHVSQPSISKVLRHAEAQIGFTLFRVVKGRLAPTEEAHVLFQEVRELQGRIESLQETTKNLRQGGGGHLRLAVLPSLRQRVDEKFRRYAENQSFLVESVTGIETLKAAAVEPQMQSRWERQLAGYVGAGFSAAMLGNWGSQAIQLVSKLTTVAILYFGAKLVIEGDLTVGMLVAFNMLAGRVSQPILRLAQLAQDFQQAKLAVDRLGDVLNAPPEPTSASRSSLPDIRGRITFDQVRFRYRPDAPEVLRGISFEVQAGEMIGIVGPSGSGKSTLTKLVQRLHVPVARDLGQDRGGHDRTVDRVAADHRIGAAEQLGQAIAVDEMGVRHARAMASTPPGRNRFP